MGKSLLVLAILCVLLYACVRRSDAPSNASVPPDPHAGVRGACKLFIEQRQLETAQANWGDISTWHVVDNADGSLSVGARYSVGAGTRFTTCVMRREGSSFRLEKLSRLQ